MILKCSDFTAVWVWDSDPTEVLLDLYIYKKKMALLCFRGSRQSGTKDDMEKMGGGERLLYVCVVCSLPTSSSHIGQFGIETLILLLLDPSCLSYRSLSLCTLHHSSLSSFNWNHFPLFFPVVFSFNCSMLRKMAFYLFEGFLPDLFWLLNNHIVLEIIYLDHIDAPFNMHSVLLTIKLITVLRGGALRLVMLNIEIWASVNIMKNCQVN